MGREPPFTWIPRDLSGPGAELSRNTWWSHPFNRLGFRPTLRWYEPEKSIPRLKCGFLLALAFPVQKRLAWNDTREHLAWLFRAFVEFSKQIVLQPETSLGMDPPERRSASSLRQFWGLLYSSRKRSSEYLMSSKIKLCSLFWSIYLNSEKCVSSLSLIIPIPTLMLRCTGDEITNVKRSSRDNPLI